MAEETIASMGPEELRKIAETENLDEGVASEILRNPYCTVDIAERVASNRRALSSDRVRRLLCSVRGLPTPRVVDLLATLPWALLLQAAQDPKTLPLTRRMAERKLLLRLPKLTLGEKINLARRAHRALFSAVVGGGEEQVLGALLDNPRLTETDVVELLNRSNTPHALFTAILRNRRWAPRRGVRKAIVRNRHTPLPVALSALADMGRLELRALADDPAVPESVRRNAEALISRRRESP